MTDDEINEACAQLGMVTVWRSLAAAGAMTLTPRTLKVMNDLSARVEENMDQLKAAALDRIKRADQAARRESGAGK